MEVFVLDPDGTMDYPFNWTDFLDDIGDTIASVVYVLPAELTLVSDSNTTKTATPFLRSNGAVVGQSYEVTCRITTAGGRIWDDTIRLLVQEQ